MLGLPGRPGCGAAARQHLHRAHGEYRRAADSRIREGHRHQGRRREGRLGRHHQSRARRIGQSEGRRDLEHRRRAARSQHRPAGGVPAQGIRDDRGRVQDQRAVASVHRDPERLRREHQEAEARGISEDVDGPRPAAVQEPGVDGGCGEIGLGLHAAQYVPDDLQRQAGGLGQVQGGVQEPERLGQLGRRSALRQRRRGGGRHHARGQRLSLSEGRRTGRDRLSGGRDVGDRRRHGAGARARPIPTAGKAFIDWALSAADAEDGGPGARPAADPEGRAAARRAEAARPDQARQVRHQERRRQAQGIHGQVAGALSKPAERARDRR